MWLYFMLTFEINYENFMKHSSNLMQNHNKFSTLYKNDISPEGKQCKYDTIFHNIISMFENFQTIFCNIFSMIKCNNFAHISIFHNIFSTFENFQTIFCNIFSMIKCNNFAQISILHNIFSMFENFQTIFCHIFPMIKCKNFACISMTISWAHTIQTSPL